MDLNRKIEKLTTMDEYLCGIYMVLEDIYKDARFPSKELVSAVSHIKKAQVEIEKELNKLKRK